MLFRSVSRPAAYIAAAARPTGFLPEWTDPAQYVPRLISDLDLPEETKQRAVELLEAGKREAVHSGKNPVGLAAAAIYAAGRLTNIDVTQHEVADAADVSAVTIRDRYTELLDADDQVA